MSIPLRVKGPNALYHPLGVDWSTTLAVGETIGSSTWFVDSADDGDPTKLVIEDFSFDGTDTTVWVSGGVLGTKYELVNRITWTSGTFPRTEDQTIRVSIEEQ